MANIIKNHYELQRASELKHKEKLNVLINPEAP